MTSKLAPISTYAPFIDCPACKGLGLVPENYNDPLGYFITCEACDGTGKYLPPLVPVRHAVEGKHLLWILGIAALVFGYGVWYLVEAFR